MRILLVFALVMVSLCAHGAMIPFTAPRGTNGITVISNVSQGVVIIDGSGISGAASTNAAGRGMTNVVQDNTVFADAAFGNNTTAIREDLTKPYLGISNAVAALQNGDTLRIWPGRYVIPAVPGQRTNASLYIVGKTNITIEGYGASLEMSGLGSMWNIRSCSNITFKGLRMVGLMTNNVLPDQSACIWMQGNIDRLTVRHCDFVRWANHGVAHPSDDATYADHQLYEGNFFDTIGSTNGVGVLTTDGTALATLSRNAIVRGNRFRNCVRGVEAFTASTDFNQEWGNVLIEGNYFDEIIDYGIFNIHSNCPNWIVKGNVFTAYPTNNTEGNQVGILINTARQWVIEDNIFQGVAGSLYNNATINTAGVGLDDMSYRFNIHSNISSRCIVVYFNAGSVSTITRWDISHNTFFYIGGDAFWGCLDNSRISDNNITDSSALFTVSAITQGNGVPCKPGTNTVITWNRIRNSGATDFTDASIVLGAEAYNTKVYGNLLGPNVAAISNSGNDTEGLLGDGFTDYLDNAGVGYFWTCIDNTTGDGIWQPLAGFTTVNLTNLFTINQGASMRFTTAESYWQVWVPPSAGELLSITNPFTGMSLDMGIGDLAVARFRGNLNVTNAGLSQVVPISGGIITAAQVREMQPNDFVIWDDFAAVSATTGLLGREAWATSAAGGGNVSVGQAWFLVRPGTLELRTGGTLADRILVHNAANIALSNGPVRFEISVYIPILPTTGNNYQSRWGLHDGLGDTPATDGCYIELTNTTAHPQYKFVTANNSTRTVSTGISNAVAGWNYLAWECNSLGTSVVFYQGTSRTNASPVATNVANIPIDWVGARVANVALSLLGSNAITVTNHIDYVGYRHQWDKVR